MSLYLAIFDEDHECIGWVLGHYSDFGYFRAKIATTVNAADYPTLMSHADSDGEWSVDELGRLANEVRTIADIFKKIAPEEPTNAFEHTRQSRSRATTLYECFHNVDGENLFDALVRLCEEGQRRKLPILFQ